MSAHLGRGGRGSQIGGKNSRRYGFINAWRERVEPLGPDGPRAHPSHGLSRPTQRFNLKSLPNHQSYTGSQPLEVDGTNSNWQGGVGGCGQHVFGGDRCLQSARILTTDQDPSFQLSVVVLAAVFDTATGMFASRDIHTLPFRLHITGIQSRLLLRACTSLSALTVPAAWTNTGSVPAGPKQVWVFRNCLRNWFARVGLR